jgi:hypothetical protein
MSLLTQIPENELIEGRWYVGRGRRANVAYWTGKTFLTIGFTFAQAAIKDEGYYGPEAGCFQPFALIDEGHTVESVGPGKDGWEKHYAKSVLIPSPTGDPNKCKEDKPTPKCQERITPALGAPLTNAEK